MNLLTKLAANLWVRIGFAVVVAIVLIILPLISSKFVNYQLSLIAVFGVALVGLNIVMGYAGQVSLGQSAFLGLGAYIAAYGVVEGWPIPLIFVLCAVVPAIVGLLVALAAARLRGLALAMVTIALPIIGIPLAKRLREFTGGSQGTTVSWLRAPEWSGLDHDQWRYYVVVFIAVLMFLIARNIVTGRIGRAFRVVKENEAVAIAMGVSPYRYKVLAFTIASLFGGVAGFLYLGVVQYTSPETLSFHTSINLVAAMVIGGSGSILGTVFAAVYYVFVPNFANEINPQLTALVSGLVLLAVLFLVPGGIVSLPRRIAQGVRAVRRRTGGTPPDPFGPGLRAHSTASGVHRENERKEARSMMNFRNATRVSGVVATGAIAALLVTGCSRGDDGNTGGDEVSPGITDTSLTLGISSPLSGATAGPGSCSVAGLYTYLEAGNAAGGFEFGDGNTREVTLEYLDDVYDPAKAVSNFRQLVDDDEIFAYVGALGTPTNLAIMPVANEEEVPQVLLITGATAFSRDQEGNPWTMGLLPTYYDEGFAFGELLAERGEVTVATLAQNDDYGDDYIAGFEAAIEGTDVEVVASATYEPTDPTLDGQVTELAASGADALLSAVSVTPLQVGVLTKAQSLGWTPEIFLPSNTSTPATVVIPGNGAAYPAVYSTSLSKVPASPAFAEDQEVVAYNEAFAEYGSTITQTFTPHCAWSYAEGAILEEAFKNMEEPTRASFMEALQSIEDFEAPLLLDGITVNTTDRTLPAIQGLTLVQFNGQGYGPVQ